jgi:hypothetical protein
MGDLVRIDFRARRPVQLADLLDMTAGELLAWCKARGVVAIVRIGGR